MEIGLKRKADNDESFPDEHEIKRRFAESSKNWNDLPVEMKMACIQWMDFETRCNLGQTSRTEQLLLVRKRYPIIYLNVRLEYDNGNEFMYWVIQISQGDSCPPQTLMKKFTLPATRKELEELEMIFRLGAIKNVDITGTARFTEEKYNPFAYFSPDVVVMIDNLNLRSTTKFALPILRQCKTLKSIVFSKETVIPRDIFEIPSIYKTPNVKFYLSEARTLAKPRAQYPIRVVQKWIEKNGQVGQRLEVEGSEKNVFDSFLQKFGKRIKYKTDEEVRISTNNRRRHIFLKGNFGKAEPLSCSIVPSVLNYHDLLCQMADPVVLD